PVLARSEHARGGCALLLDPVGFCEERVEIDAADATHVDVHAADLLVAARLDLNLGGLFVPRSCLAGPLELASKLVGLACARVQQRIRLAGGDRLDPARAGADRALGEDQERADLGRRAQMRAAA